LPSACGIEALSDNLVIEFSVSLYIIISC